MKKSLIGLLMITVILMALAVPLASVPAVSAADSAGWYKTVSGVLDTDAYSLYPYYTFSTLKIGFSKFGEMINSNDNVGLQYGYSMFGMEEGVDPFAPPYGSSLGIINKWAMLNGWICNITYYHTIRSEMRNVWVSAQHGDPGGVTYGGDWIRVDFPNDHVGSNFEDPRDPGYIIGNYVAGNQNYGGRKTNGTAVTADIQVLYDGPRSFIALLKTTIYDHFLYQSDSTAEDIPLLEVRFMINFNKVNKEVVVFKELKTLVTDKYTDIMKVQFSNRGEVDLGNEDDDYASYFHFYTQGTALLPGPQPDSSDLLLNTGDLVLDGQDLLIEGQSTVYDRNWVINTTEASDDAWWPGYSAAGPYPQDSNATYDLATAINPEAGYTWWAAFWPSLSDWSIDGWEMWWHSMTATDPHDIDSRTWEDYPRYEPTIPYYIGEWDVELKPKGKTTPSGGYDQQQYRFVTVYGVSERQNGDDANITPDYFSYFGQNTIDREAMYQLNEVFNPWDLNQAVHKTLRSWVEWTTGSTSYTTLRKPVVVVDGSLWGDYNVGSERVLDLNSTYGALLRRSGTIFDQYAIVKNADGTATISGLNASRTYKILYNTLPDVSGSATAANTYSHTYYNTTDGETGDGIPVATAGVNAITTSATWKDQIDAAHSFSVTVPSTTVYVMSDANLTSNWTETYTVTKMYNETDFKVFLGETYVATLPDLYDSINITLTNSTFMFDIGSIMKSLAATTNTTVIWPNDKSETTHCDYLNHTITFAITITNNNYTLGPVTGPMLNQTLAVSATLTVRADYRDYLMGRYEWAVVGRDAASVDSAGAALITAAFKNKQVEIGMAGADMYDTEVANQMPWVMSKMSTGDEWVNYLKTGAGTDPGNYRAYLRDDWCRQGTLSGDEWPVASSNMIGVGGPLANLLAYYANDFTSAIFGLSDFTNYTAWKNKIAPVTCWNHAQGYTDTNLIGYAVISTYLDLNGTVVFLVWGNWGRDTFYASKWFHEHGVYQLQSAPRGLTSEVIKITYESTGEGYKPTNFSIVECLGTISERLWYPQYSELYWEGVVYSATGESIASPILDSGKTYHIEASEIFWYDYDNHLEADAMYYTTAAVNWDWVNHFPAPDGHSFLQIDNADVNWGPFSNGDTGHTYSITYIGQGEPITFRIVDWMDQNYENNVCHFPISIYVVIRGEYKGGIHDP